MKAHVKIRKRRASHIGVRPLSSPDKRAEEENGLDAEHSKDSCEHSMCVEG